MKISYDDPPRPGWRGFRAAVSVAGVQFRQTSVRSFASGAQDASDAGSAFGVRLVRDPSNEFDKNAIRVVGFWKHAGIFRLVEKRALLGFVDASTAKDLCTEFGDAPLAARLLSFYESQTGFIDLKIIILVPGKHATHQSASSS